MTISPPSKVPVIHDDNVTVLASNLDKLDLAVAVRWFDDTFLKQLEKLKTTSVNNGGTLPIILKPLKSSDSWKGMIKPHGADGYAFLVIGNEYNLKIGNWVEPIDRPSVMIEIRSETLWRLGPETAVARIIDVLKGQGKGCIVESIKPSRVDICVDALFPPDLWSEQIMIFKVMRASKWDVHYGRGDKLEGISIGKKKLSARLYDKALEIKEQSKKFWMYDMWDLNEEEVPKHMRIVRTEFQLRREAIRELGIDTVDELLSHQANVWGHCTQKWLRFMDKPGTHTSKRTVLEWWRAIQDGYKGVEQPSPLIRFKAANAKDEQLCSQMDGLLSSREALAIETYAPDSDLLPDRSIALDLLTNTLDATGKDQFHFMDAVNEKRAQFKRSREKAIIVKEERRSKGFPCNIGLENRFHQLPLKESSNGREVSDD